MITKIHSRYITLMVLISSMVYSCSDDSNSSIETSEDVIELAKYIDLETYKPTEVKWSYVKMGNQNESRTPGTNDYKLEAELQFDKETIQKIKDNYSLLSVSLREFRKDQFRFEWLDKKYLNKVNSNNSLIYYHPNFFKKGSLIHGGYTIIDETTILLSLHTM